MSDCGRYDILFPRKWWLASDAETNILRSLYSDLRPSSLERSLVGQVCVARMRLREDLRDSSGRQARVRRTYFSPSPRTSDRCADFLLPDSRLSRRKPFFGQVCVACTRLLRWSKMFSKRKASIGALSRIVRAVLISRQFGHLLPF